MIIYRARTFTLERALNLGRRNVIARAIKLEKGVSMTSLRIRMDSQILRSDRMIDEIIALTSLCTVDVHIIYYLLNIRVAQIDK